MRDKIENILAAACLVCLLSLVGFAIAFVWVDNSFFVKCAFTSGILAFVFGIMVKGNSDSNDYP